MSTYTYPHTIENGAGERLTFVRRVQDPTGDRLEVENLVKPGSADPRCTSATTRRRPSRFGRGASATCGPEGSRGSPGLEIRSSSSRGRRTNSETPGKRTS